MINIKAYQILALFILAIFYSAYFTKMYLQKQKGIQTDQINKGFKPPKTQRVERVMSFATRSIVIIELVSIIFDWRIIVSKPMVVIGLIISSLGVITFIIAMITMKDSWRAGINKNEKTQLITVGIYQYSRNPAFLGFDLMYTGVLISFFNIPLLCFTVLTVITLHLQILQEEAFLPTLFGSSYVEYMKQTFRYIGRTRF